MCCCGKPNINGMVNAYSWDGKSFSTRQPNPPVMEEGDELLYDEPGRCGGLDCHSHHFRLVKGRYGYAVLVRHGGGDERIDLGMTVVRYAVLSLAALDSNGRFWLFHTLYSTNRDARQSASQERDQYWRQAAATGRIKTRKQRNGGLVKVWVEYPKPAPAGEG